MAINLVIAVTDGDWFDMLRQQPNLAEVNFWAPSAANFRALQPGELFLFKLHAPRNVIVDGGIFAYGSRSRNRSDRPDRPVGNAQSGCASLGPNARRSPHEMPPRPASKAAHLRRWRSQQLWPENPQFRAIPGGETDNRE